MLIVYVYIFIRKNSQIMNENNLGFILTTVVALRLAPRKFVLSSFESLISM